jgi:hypothetical protein
LSVPVYPFQLPPQNTQLLGFGLSGVGQVFYNFFRVLFLRTGGASGIVNTVGTDLAATGQILTNDYNEILVGGGITNIVVLANLQPGQVQAVYNGIGGNLTIHPFGSGTIDGGASYTLPNTKTQYFVCTAQLANGFPAYRSTQLG